MVKKLKKRSVASPGPTPSVRLNHEPVLQHQRNPRRRTG